MPGTTLSPLPGLPCSWPRCDSLLTTQTERWHLEGRKPWLCAAHLAELSALPYAGGKTAMELISDLPVADRSLDGRNHR